MIWGAIKRMFITEVYARIVVAMLLATLGTIGLLASRHSGVACALGLATMVLVYRLKYKRW